MPWPAGKGIFAAKITLFAQKDNSRFAPEVRRRIGLLLYVFGAQLFML